MTILIAGYDIAQAIKNKADYICDGTNDEIEIMAAMNALGTGYWAELQLVGTFNTSPFDGTAFGLIMNRSKTIWRGPAKLNHSGGGDNAIIGDHAYFQPVTVTDVIVEDLEMTSAGGSIGIGLVQQDTSVSRVKLRRLYIHDCLRDGPDAEIAMSNQGGLRDVIVEDCNIHDVRLGVDFGSHQRKYIDGLVIRNNIIRDWTGGYAIGVYGAFNGTEIVNNQCLTTLGLGHGIELGDSSEAGEGWPIRRSQIRGNIITGITQAGRHGIFCYGFSDLKLLSNSIYASQEGIHFGRGNQGYSDMVQTIGNVVIVNGAFIPAYVADTDVRRQLVLGNHLESSGHNCLYFYGGSSTFLVVNNHQLKAGFEGNYGWPLARVQAGARGCIAGNIANTLTINAAIPADIITDFANLEAFPN